MIKKVFLTVIALSLAAVATVGVIVYVEKTTDLKSAIHALDGLTDELVSHIGNKPTVESIKLAQQVFEERKASVKERLKLVEQSNKYRADSEIGMELKICKEANLDKVGDVYSNLLSKNDKDLEAMVQLREEKRKLEDSKSNTKDINNQIKNLLDIIKENYNLLDAMEDLVKNYKSIYEEGRKEEQK